MYDGVWGRTVGLGMEWGWGAKKRLRIGYYLTDEFFETGEGVAKEEEKYMY